MDNHNVKIREEIIVFIFLLIIAFFFLLMSPLHPWNGEVTGTDSSVFKTIALMMEKGYMPYRDSFDHKGPLLFIINYLGNKISYYRGVWVIEYIFKVITFFMIYKISRITVSPRFALLTTFMAISLGFEYYEGGNLTEDYAMCFIAVSIYIFLKYIVQEDITSYEIAMSGFCFMAVCLLRPNMTAVWIAFCVAIFSKTIIEKNWGLLGKFVKGFSLGAALLLVPIIIWLAANHSLKQCYNDYILFNSMYISADGGTALISAKWKSFWHFFNSSILIMSFCGLFFNVKNKLFLNITYLIYMILSLILICLSGRKYGHYGLILVPLVGYPLSLLFNMIEKIENIDIRNTMAVIAGIYSILTFISPKWIDMATTFPERYEQRNEYKISDTQKKIVKIIDEYTTLNDAISVYGNWDCIYVLSKRKHATRYSYQVPIGNVKPEIMDEYMEQLQNELPPIIVVQDRKYDAAIAQFLDRNDYFFVWGERGNLEDGGAMVFRLESLGK